MSDHNRSGHGTPGTWLKNALLADWRMELLWNRERAIMASGSAMGFNGELQDELGGRIDGVDDPRGLLNKLLPEPGGDECLFLGSIDPYGDTTFNHFQMPRFLKEWAHVLLKAAAANEQAIALAEEALARRCGDEVHTYLKFIGD